LISPFLSVRKGEVFEIGDKFEEQFIIIKVIWDVVMPSWQGGCCIENTVTPLTKTEITSQLPDHLSIGLE
jgi:hypothetical protein